MCLGRAKFKNCTYKKCQSKTTIKQLIERFQQSGSEENKRAKRYTLNGRSQKHIDCVFSSVVDEPKISIIRSLQQVGLCEITTCVFYEKNNLEGMVSTGWHYTSF